MKAKGHLLIDLLHTATLATLALAQPLFDLLARNAEFFVVRRSEPIDVLLLVAVLVACPALALTGLQAVLLNRRWRRYSQGLIVALFVAAILLPVLKRTGLSSGAMLVWAAALIGLAAGVGYVRLSVIRWFMTALSPAVLVCPGLFLLDSRISRLIHPPATAGSPQPVAQAAVSCTTPVVMLVFDELPLISLLDENLEIDAERYPSFAALAGEAIWFRNATTVHNMTTHAVPALLTGRYPDWSQLPITADYPDNLFTWLGHTHRLKVLEPVTRLCPIAAGDLGDRLTPRPGLFERLRSLAADLSVVYLHLVLPEEWSGRLPAVTHGWKDFRGGSCCGSIVVNEERPEQFARFVRSMSPSDGPAVYFMHLVLPHWPFNFLPSGKHYGINMDLDGVVPPGHRWGTEQARIEQTYQRHLLQVGYADTLLGRAVERLKEMGLYDRSLIVVAADHGISFRPGDAYRHLTETNLEDIARVPLLIKKPGQREGMVSDRAVQLIDVLPTMADILNERLPWPVDGRSAVDSHQPEWAERVCFSRDTAWKLPRRTIGIAGELRRKLDLFGSGPLEVLYRRGPHPELVGRRAADLNVAGESGVAVEVDKARFLTNVEPHGGFVPAQLKGTAYLPSETSEPLHLAVALNGVIRATATTFEHGPGLAKWSVMLPESAFQQGNNALEVFVVRAEAGDFKLHRTTLAEHRADYRLALLEKALVRADHSPVPITARSWQGHLDYVHRQGECLEFGGWAADVTAGRLPDSILVFAGERLVHAVRPGAERNDLPAAYGHESLRRAGFRFSLPTRLLEERAEVRLFALGAGAATELRYPTSYRKRGYRPQ